MPQSMPKGMVCSRPCSHPPVRPLLRKLLYRYQHRHQHRAPEPAPVVAVKTDSEPQIVELVKPVFTADVLALPSGEVVIMVQIDPEGKPVKTMVAKSTNPAFNQPIVTAVLRSTFEPGTTASVPAVKWLTIPFRVN